MSLPAPLPGLARMSERYDVFLIDQFGVLHDGTRPYPGAAEGLAALKRCGKRLILLSNSGRRSAPNMARLARLGFPPELYDSFVSSGEVAWRLLAKGAVGGLRPGARCLVVSRDGDLSPIEGLDFHATDNAGEADFVIIAGSEGDRCTLDDYAIMLAPAARRRLPCLCLNPDKIMLTPVGPRFGAGRIAELYRDLGGEVIWIGKPYAEIYRVALDAFGIAASPRVVGVGDSVEHDVAGAKGAGCDAALVLSGIHANDAPAEILAACHRYQVWPDAVLSSFRWDGGSGAAA